MLLTCASLAAGAIRMIINRKKCKRILPVNNLLCVCVCVCVCMQGINYLVENKLLDGSAQSIADFLYKEEGLNKTAIGEFLGER